MAPIPPEKIERPVVYMKGVPWELDEPTSYEDPCPSTRRKPSKRCWNLLALSVVVVLLYHWLSSPLFIGKGLSAHGDVKCGAKEAEFDWFKIKPSEDIEWTPCYDGQQCARLSVPLDWLTPEGPKAAIALRLLPAKDQKNYKGAVFVNPGGPGGSGTYFVERKGQQIQTVLGDEYAILGFDPRGTGATTPSSQCFDTDAQFRIWNIQEGTTLLNASAESIPLARSREQAVGERCLQTIGGNGKDELNGTAEEWGPGRFMTTASVTTDMVRILEKLGQEKLLYWGFSYGSVLGQYFAAMYPEKVGRLAIDGVYDSHDYRRTRWFTNLENTDDALESFFTFCHQAGPDKCKLYSDDVGAIRDRVLAILDQLTAAPVPVPFSTEGPVVFTRKSMQGILFQYTYSPLQMALLVADILLAAEARNQTALGTIGIPRFNLGYNCDCADAPLPWMAENEAFYAIACGDGDPVLDVEDEYEQYFEELMAKSPFAAPIWGVHRLQCAGWKVRAKWRYTGPLSANNTAHPLLVVSPTVDPVCPLSDAKRVRERYTGAGLLQQASFGHCSLSSPSLCTAKHVRTYFVNGTLPEEGTVCEVDELPFIGKVGQSLVGLSREDEQLLNAVRELSTEVLKFGNW